ncbi:MAG TPA: histidine phosphatase family protein [Dongiaceae bacterium]|nr:histidine phosphatase family protein [Dongiaceae bacterium]
MTPVLPPRFVFVRHGRTEWNMRGLVMGQRDIPLDAVGERQAEAAGTLLGRLPLTSVWRSPLGRCRATAAPLLALHRDLPEFVLDGLKERHWGRFQGLGEDQRPARKATPPEGESLADFTRRTLAALAAIDDRDLPVVFAHSGTLRVLLHCLGLESADPTPNAVPLMIRPRARREERVQPLRDTTGMTGRPAPATGGSVVDYD